MFRPRQDVFLQSRGQLDKHGREAPNPHNERPILGCIGVLASLLQRVSVNEIDLKRRCARQFEKTVDERYELLESLFVMNDGFVQGNVEQSVKWNPDFQAATIDKYLRLSKGIIAQRPDIVVWPETALPFYFGHNKEMTDSVTKGLRQMRTDFLFGSPAFTRKAKTVAYFNSAFLTDSNGDVRGQYNKAHLVPFGEYVPLKRWLPFLGKMVAQVGDFATGRVGDTITWRNHRLGVLICYEAIFPYISRSVVNNGAALLINITNDAWYGTTAAPYQLFSMTVFRAVENRRALVRAANTGISGYIDPAGRVRSKTGLYNEDAATSTVPLLSERTFYTRYGDSFALLGIALVLVLAGWKFAEPLRRRLRR